ncbi:MBL fold metallo-hydrolase [Helicovermis profundi]|uniref:MBL fold metallo-hydrolase n=1 Tax=Helicovermis profundi TaxID=3065157 RepID=A0AAU9E4V6_9FIRM|nr:MBL fold metallo-hydrolase [Clostridia bacterium S502]
MELHRIGENTFYFDNPSIIGLYLFESNNVLLIDTGIDKDTIKKAIKIIEEKNWKIKYIINTHSHADHCGGNYYLLEKYDIAVYASSLEKVMIENSILEPAYLYGAYPQKKLQKKFLMAKSSKVSHVVEYGELIIENKKFDIIDLKGHSPQLIGVVTDDDICFLGDSIFPDYIIEKHNLLFLFDYKNTVNTLNCLKDEKHEKYVLSHGGVIENLEPVIDYNIKALKEVNDYIFSLLTDYKSIEDIHRSVVNNYEIRENLPQFYLNISVIKAHLTYLVDEKIIINSIIDSEVKWKINNK